MRCAPRRLPIFVGVATLVFSGCAVNPVTHKSELSLMSESQEVQAGEQAYPIYTQMSQGLFQDAALQSYVQSVGKRTAAVSHRPTLDYEFNVVNDSALNAYALPAGKISITRGLLSKMDNEAELAGVLGHEVGHVTARHAAAGYTRQVLVGVLTGLGAVALEVADVKGRDLLLQGGMLTSNLVLMKYSRDQERQSDELGMKYMADAGYNPEGFIESMQILLREQQRAPSTVESFFSSHPLTTERVSAAQNRLPDFNSSVRTEEKLKAAEFRGATVHLRQVGPAYARMDEGLKLLGDKKAEAAVKALSEATALAPGEALIWTYRAAAEATADKKQDALASAEKAVQLYPDLYQARFTAAIAAFDVKKHAQSREHLAVADKLIPDQPQVAFYRGRNFEAEGQREPAAREFSKVVEQVQKGPMAEYSYKRLTDWGYIKPQPKQAPQKPQRK